MPMSNLEIPQVEAPDIAPVITSTDAQPVYLQGVFPFMGNGLLQPGLLHPDLRVTMPPGRYSRLAYFRAGNAADTLIYLSVLVGGKVHRYFPIGPQSHTHVALAIRESFPAGTRIEIHLAAPDGVLGTVIVDAGLVTMPELVR
jgi:assimilatory nitrate reductase catalytic subunit